MIFFLPVKHYFMINLDHFTNFFIELLVISSMTYETWMITYQCISVLWCKRPHAHRHLTILKHIHEENLKNSLFGEPSDTKKFQNGFVIWHILCIFFFIWFDNIFEMFKFLAKFACVTIVGQLSTLYMICI